MATGNLRSVLMRLDATEVNHLKQLVSRLDLKAFVIVALQEVLALVLFIRRP
jgi:hypothetical protein